MKRIKDLQPGDVYRHGGDITWKRVEKLLPGKMMISTMQFDRGIPRWVKQKSLISNKGSMMVEMKG